MPGRIGTNGAPRNGDGTTLAVRRRANALADRLTGDGITALDWPAYMGRIKRMIARDMQDIVDNGVRVQRKPTGMYNSTPGRKKVQTRCGDRQR